MVTLLTPDAANAIHADRLREAEQDRRASQARRSFTVEPGLWIVRLWSRTPRETSLPSVPPSQRAA